MHPPKKVKVNENLKYLTLSTLKCSSRREEPRAALFELGSGRAKQHTSLALDD